MLAYEGAADEDARAVATLGCYAILSSLVSTESTLECMPARFLLIESRLLLRVGIKISKDLMMAFSLSEIKFEFIQTRS